MPSSTEESYSKTFMVDSSDSETENEDLALVHMVLNKLTIKDQTLLHRLFKKVPEAFNNLWRDQHQCLDFGKLQWKLHGANLQLFLQDMCTEFRSVHFRSEHLQEELNILEQAGIEHLINVEFCEITWDNSLAQKYTKFPQWPLHALPKLLSNLLYLEMHAPVQACYIEQFKKLESLKIYDEISSSALKEILSTDADLKLFHLAGNLIYQLSGISKCKHLSNLLVNLQTFLTSPKEILQLPELLVLRLTQLTENKEALNTLSLILEQKGSRLKSFQLNCSFMDTAENLAKLELNRCLSLEELELVNCKFENQDIIKLCLPSNQTYALFCNCLDLIDGQLLIFIKASTKLKEIVLINCPKLTVDLLHDVVKVRITREQEEPLLIRVKDCPELWDSYQKNLAIHWSKVQSIIKLECLMDNYNPKENVQFTFHELEGRRNIQVQA